MYEEISVIDKIEIAEDGQIQVRRADRVLRDGVIIANTYHRHVLEPGDTVDSADERLVAVTEAVWTKDTVDKFKKAKAEREPK